MTIDNAEQEFVSVSGGYLVQDKDNKDVTRNDMTVVRHSTYRSTVGSYAPRLES